MKGDAYFKQKQEAPYPCVQSQWAATYEQGLSLLTQRALRQLNKTLIRERSKGRTENLEYLNDVSTLQCQASKSEFMDDLNLIAKKCYFL